MLLASSLRGAANESRRLNRVATTSLHDEFAPQNYQMLRLIRERDDVTNLLIEVKDLKYLDGWPSADLF